MNKFFNICKRLRYLWLYMSGVMWLAIFISFFSGIGQIDKEPWTWGDVWFGLFYFLILLLTTILTTVGFTKQYDNPYVR